MTVMPVFRVTSLILPTVKPHRLTPHERSQTGEKPTCHKGTSPTHTAVLYGALYHLQLSSTLPEWVLSGWQIKCT